MKVAGERARRLAGDRDGHGAAIAEGLAELSRWAASLAWRDVPEAVQRRVARGFADDLAVIVAARAEPELAALVARLARASGPPEATLFDGSGRRLDRYSAALANGSAADWCELDGGYRKGIIYESNERYIQRRVTRLKWLEKHPGSTTARECR